MGALESSYLKNVSKSMTKFRNDDRKVVNVTKTVPLSESLSALANSLLNFTNDICNIFELDNQLEGNYICSTLSAHVVLSMAACGADNNTAVQMKNVLHIASDELELLEHYQKLFENLNPKEKIEPMSEDDINSPRFTRKNSENDEKGHPCIVTLANKIYVAEGVKVKEDFENILSIYFRSKSETLNFSKSDESAEIINKWCCESTKGKITHILSPDELDSSTTLILTNAVYFKGNWVDPFSYVMPKTFHLNMHKEIEVPTMHLQDILYYRNLPELNAQAVRLYFMGKNYMDIIVPNEIDGLKTIQRNVNEVNKVDFEGRHVNLWLPKFEIESTIIFNNHLEKLGMTDAFDGILADFNKMCDRHVSIGQVIQKAFIKVDEIGCEAAACSLAGLVDMCGSTGTPTYIDVIADRPFLFRIMDNKLNIPLFIGSVVHPQ